MSDTSDSRTEPLGPVEGGSGRTFKIDIPVDENETLMSEEEAVRLLWERFAVRPPPQKKDFWWGVKTGLLGPLNVLPGINDEQGRPGPLSRALLTNLVRSIPMEVRTRSVLAMVDIRPFLLSLAGTEKGIASGPQYLMVNGQAFTRAQRREATLMLIQENSLIEKELYEQAKALPEGTDVEAWMIEQREKYQTDTSLGVRPGTLPTDLAGEMQDGVGRAEREAYESGRTLEGSLIDQLDIDSIPSNTEFIPTRTQAQIDQLFQTGIVNWMDIIEAEAVRKAQGEDPYRIEVGDNVLAQPDPSWGYQQQLGPGGSAMQKPATPDAFLGDKTRSLTLMETYNKIFDRNTNPGWIRNIQEKLELAGYLEEDGYLVGDNSDQATVNAWHQLVIDSARTKRPMAEILAERTRSVRAKKEAEEETPLQDIILTSKPMITLAADRLAIDTIGRRLEPQDHARLIEFIQGLERKQQTTLDQPGSQEVERVDVDDEIEAWIERTKPVESQSNDLLGQYQAFSQAVRETG